MNAESEEKEGLTDHPEKCTKQHAQTAAQSVKYHSSRVVIGLSTVGSVIKNTGRRGGGDTKVSNETSIHNYANWQF